MGETKKIESGRSREILISERAEILEELAEAEKAVFFGSNFSGSHEFTNEGYCAAKDNEYLRNRLKRELGEVNKQLGLKEDSRE